MHTECDQKLECVPSRVQYVAILGRNQTLFHCIFRLHYHFQSGFNSGWRPRLHIELVWNHSTIAIVHSMAWLSGPWISYLPTWKVTHGHSTIHSYWRWEKYSLIKWTLMHCHEYHNCYLNWEILKWQHFTRWTASSSLYWLLDIISKQHCVMKMYLLFFCIYCFFVYHVEGAHSSDVCCSTWACSSCEGVAAGRSWRHCKRQGKD